MASTDDFGHIGDVMELTICKYNMMRTLVFPPNKPLRGIER